MSNVQDSYEELKRGGVEFKRREFVGQAQEPVVLCTYIPGESDALPQKLQKMANLEKKHVFRVELSQDHE